MIVVGSTGAGVPMISVIVGISVVILVLGAHLPLLSTIPAGVYGYASTAAFVLLTAPLNLAAPAVIKAAVMVVISLIIGNAFGYVSEKLAGMLAKS